MPCRRGVLLGLSLCVALGFGPPAWATIDNLKSYKLAYPGKEAKAYSCKVCHNSVVGKKGDLNAYGLALQKSKAPTDAKKKKLTEADFRAIEKDDADGDGASNLDEINAGTAPGDPQSVPASATPLPEVEERSTKEPVGIHEHEHRGDVQGSEAPAKQEVGP